MPEASARSARTSSGSAATSGAPGIARARALRLPAASREEHGCRPDDGLDRPRRATCRRHATAATARAPRVRSPARRAAARPAGRQAARPQTTHEALVPSTASASPPGGANRACEPPPARAGHRRRRAPGRACRILHARQAASTPRAARTIRPATPASRARCREPPPPTPAHRRRRPAIPPRAPRSPRRHRRSGMKMADSRNGARAAIASHAAVAAAREPATRTAQSHSDVDDGRSEREAQADRASPGSSGTERRPAIVRRHAARERDAAASDATSSTATGHEPLASDRQQMFRRSRPRPGAACRAARSIADPRHLAAHEPQRAKRAGPASARHAGTASASQGAYGMAMASSRQQGSSRWRRGAGHGGVNRRGPAPRPDPAQEKRRQERERHEPDELDRGRQHGDARLAARDGEHVERAAGEPGAHAGRDARGGVGGREPAGHQERPC